MAWIKRWLLYTDLWIIEDILMGVAAVLSVLGVVGFALIGEAGRVPRIGGWLRRVVVGVMVLPLGVVLVGLAAIGGRIRVQQFSREQNGRQYL